ncbi:hypothetical protein L1887_48477 [Cichorium endivia]|nr:hypothetical protein L1887_48477 [Cichorium endivia]
MSGWLAHACVAARDPEMVGPWLEEKVRKSVGENHGGALERETQREREHLQLRPGEKAPVISLPSLFPSVTAPPSTLVLLPLLHSRHVRITQPCAPSLEDVGGGLLVALGRRTRVDHIGGAECRDQVHNARHVAHHDFGRYRRVEGQGRPGIFGGRRAARNRNRQGHHGRRGSGRRHHGQDRRAGRCQGRRRRQDDRDDRRGGRRHLQRPGARGRCCSAAASSDPSAQTSDKSEPVASTQTAASTAAAAPSTPGASSSNAHHHFKGPLFPSVQRLIAENNIEDAETKIKGTGVRGMITKGDVLAFLGKAKTPTGSFKEPKGGIAVLGPSQSAPKTGPASGTAPKAPLEPLTGDALRSLIIGGLASSSRSARQAASAPAPAPVQPFSQQAVDSALEGYTFSAASTPAPVPTRAARKQGIRTDDPLWDLI